MQGGPTTRVSTSQLALGVQKLKIHSFLAVIDQQTVSFDQKVDLRMEA